MTSAINPSNIDGTYPVAGQDNNSQGFRDNFTNTKTNFQYAANEITDLQNKALLKAALTGTTLNNDMGGAVISNVQLQGQSYTAVAKGTLSTTVPVNVSAGSYQTVTPGSSVTLAFSNWPTTGQLGEVTVQFTISSASYTVTLPAAVSVGTTGIQGLTSSTISFAAAGTYSYTFSSSDAGTTIAITDVNKSLQAFNNSSETLAATPASLATTTSIITDSFSSAALPAGVPGQIKTFVQSGTTQAVITVTNAGWKSSGTGTLTIPNTRGYGCTLQYIGSKWYCVGNNGCTFA